MFKGQRFVTCGVVSSVPVSVQRLIWKLIDHLMAKHAVETDYLQVFELQQLESGGQQIIHRQEVPEYLAIYVFEDVVKPVHAKLYVIDDGEYCTMLLPEER